MPPVRLQFSRQRVESHAERADTNVLPTRGAIVFAVLGVE
jgi:hypothetical protein